MRRTPLNKFGARAQREAPELAKFRSVIRDRAHGHCERCGDKPIFIECHHVVNRARAAGWPELHNPNLNGLGLCQRCHEKLTMYPKDEGGHLEGRINCAFLAYEAWRIYDRKPVWAS